MILKVAGCLWDMSPFGRSLPAALSAGAAAAELPAAEAPQPVDGFSDMADTPMTASGRKMFVSDAMVKNFGASMGCPRCQNGAGTHTRVSSAHA